ncbi:hypothetical protein ARSEF4850_007926 [Beauveria asiatica]
MSAEPERLFSDAKITLQDRRNRLEIGIIEANFHAGTTVDITTIGQIAKVDFTKAHSGQTVAIVTHNPDRTYKVEFEYPPKMKPYRVNGE